MPKTRRVAYATCETFPKLDLDDLSTIPALEKLGMEVTPVVWDEPANWTQYDAVIIRSTWDYTEKYPQFLQWLSDLERQDVKVFNSPATIRDNTHKTYLKRISASGVPVVPTYWFEKKSRETLSSVVAKQGWGEVVLKPSVSAGSRSTYRFRALEIAEYETKLQEIVSKCEAMLQPLMPGILNEGEYSFLFFGGDFSHALLKKGPTGEFRVQHKYGGTIHPYSAKLGEMAQASLALSAYGLPSRFLYARVDMVRDPQDSKKLLLMELEVAEPNLYFLNDQANPGAAERFAKKLKSML